MKMEMAVLWGYVMSVQSDLGSPALLFIFLALKHHCQHRDIPCLAVVPAEAHRLGAFIIIHMDTSTGGLFFLIGKTMETLQTTLSRGGWSPQGWPWLSKPCLSCLSPSICSERVQTVFAHFICTAYPFEVHSAARTSQVIGM